ncbi:putative RecQ-mediated genome instability protein 1 [Monocercomonoides exilis]|uniref:putative RecQ-mediated genome instability protein 1 n=1 Tax=Monocercomonoides exilis TaxID=2049356 RepID=UPI00355A7E58|nr:putative RecQ-mediated genome instability protein 1 [Monocercomonoides exilis]|eukprot:MONOS_6199.1-p1 / transcript=MONOS_6199.1 / gene=MONOS_6199 / organism=Monocercomonoides_exilis_PA203 / gene_product=RecQ-mediated genome instability protein 1 / transcript_product=RecQ-mediated genome instability protein 1 / location=Mono_scaffold00192:31524-32477(-) / protein_length=299 / sequence_SO=supercontig / SO=protein_coding / is_pseudo=false
MSEPDKIMLQNCVEFLKEISFIIREEWLVDCILDLRRRIPDLSQNQLNEKVLSSLLISDMKSYGAPALPPGIGSIKVGKLDKPTIVQIENIQDVSLSIAERHTAQPKPQAKAKAKSNARAFVPFHKRTLVLLVTDGVQECSCLEFTFIPALSEKITLGSKILITNASIRRGIIFLQSYNVFILGGNCERCIEASQKASEAIKEILDTHAAKIAHLRSEFAEKQKSQSTPAAGAGIAPMRQAASTSLGLTSQTSADGRERQVGYAMVEPEGERVITTNDILSESSADESDGFDDDAEEG